MNVLTKLNQAVRQSASAKRREKSIERWQEAQMQKIFRACRTMMREEIPPLNKQKVNDCKITVKKINGGYRIFTEGFGYDEERTIDVTTKTFRGTYRPADDCPEQDYVSHGICITWRRRSDRCTFDEMNDSVCLESGATDWDEEVKRKHKEFQETLAKHIKRCVGL